MFFITFAFPSLVHSTRPKPPRPLASALVFSLVKITMSNLQAPTSPPLYLLIVSLEITIMMFILQRCSYDVSIMMLFPSYECGWPYKEDHVSQIWTRDSALHVAGVLPPRDFIWFELSINIYPIPYLDSLLCYYIYECERHMEMPHIKSGLKLWNIEFNPG